MKAWEAKLAGAIHAAFYMTLIAIPLTGWMLSSSSNRPTNYFGLFTIPPLPVSRSDGADDLFEDAHELLVWLALGLVSLHVPGAPKHHFEGHRHMIGRMAPCLYRSR